ncbi:MAG: replicative DNA helicase [Actinomycetota bacterium]
MATKEPSFERVPPHNLEAEESLLGAMLLSPDAIAEAQEIIESADFYREANRKIYDAIRELYVSGEPVDAITLAEILRKKSWLEEIGGKAYIHTLLNVVPTASNAAHYAKIVADNATLRRLILAAGEISAMGYSVPEDIRQVIDESENLIFKVAHDRSTGEYQMIGDLLQDAYEHLEELSASKSHVTGLETGFYELDHKTRGLQPSDFIVVAGRPSMGKTSLALSIAEHVALNVKKPVAIFSLEMSKEQLVQRMICSEARVDATHLQTGNLKEDDWIRVNAGLSRLSEAPIIIDDSANINMLGIRSKARRMDSKNKLGLIIVDYLQLMQGHSRTDNRQQEVADISRAMKILGREMHVPVIAISQLSRKLEDRPNKRPQLSDLRESGAIEQDADLVMFIYRDEMYNEHSDEKGTAEIIIGKHRHGPTGKVKLAFLEQFTKFSNLDTRHSDTPAKEYSDRY